MDSIMNSAVEAAKTINDTSYEDRVAIIAYLLGYVKGKEEKEG